MAGACKQRAAPFGRSARRTDCARWGGGECIGRQGRHVRFDPTDAGARKNELGHGVRTDRKKEGTREPDLTSFGVIFGDPKRARALLHQVIEERYVPWK